MRPRTPSRTRRAFSLFEALAVVIMVAIAIPPMAAIAQVRADAVTDAARRHAALHLAVGITEAVLADSESTAPQLGFEGLARADYMDAPVNGLRIRLKDMADPATTLGITYDLTIGPSLDVKGKPAAFDAPSALRLITVTASWTSASGKAASLALKTMVVNR